MAAESQHIRKAIAEPWTPSGHEGEAAADTDPDEPDNAFTAALVERANAGVHVRIIPDAFGSRRLRRHHVRRLTAAGCEIGWHPRARWRRAHRLTNSTHREILVVDGRVAFAGGANLDMMSFEYLDEINIAVRDEAFAREWRARHDADLARSVEVSPSWHRSVWEQGLAWAVWTLAGQRWVLGLRRRRRRRRRHRVASERGWVPGPATKISRRL